MKTIRLGRTGLVVSRTGFGALPLQRVDMDGAVRLLRAAHAGGITLFDTARAYSDSEEKLGRALADVRDRIVLATKTTATDAETMESHLEASLRLLKTDHVDILQLHNPATVPDARDPGPLYEALVKVRQQGKVRFLGVTNHRLPVARDAVKSGLFDTLQFPLSHISSVDDLALVALCREHDVGLLAMKGLCGGLLTNVPAAFAFLRQHENVVPLWGIQRPEELDQFLALEANPPVLDAALLAAVEADRRELGAAFCRACGYCLPCPAGIPIPMAARMKYLLRRAPPEQFLTEDWKRQMSRIDACTNCRGCASRCPYGLNTPRLLKVMLDDYRAFSGGVA